MLVFALALLVLLAASLPWVAVCRLQNKAPWLIALFLVCSANIVLAGLVTNSFHLLNKQWALLAFHVLAGGIGWLIWYRTGMPGLFSPFQSWRESFSWQVVKREPALTLLGLSVGLLYAFALVQIVYIPQNNMDSLSTHLSRIGFWYQHGSFFPWPTFLLNQVWYPINAQLLTYWTLLFLGSDRLVGSVQWMAALVSALCVYGLARVFGYHPRRSAFAGLIFLTFPLIALQSTTTQTDLVTAVFFLPAIYFLILGVRDGQVSMLTLSAISVGIGIGVKKSYFILLPLLAVFALLVLLQYGRSRWKWLAAWSLAVLVGAVALGSYIYVLNWRNFGGPFGPPNYVDTLVNVPDYGTEDATKVQPSLVRVEPVEAKSTVGQAGSFPGSGLFLEMFYNSPRLAYQALDTSGLPRPLDGYAHKVKMRLARAFFLAIGFPQIEGTSYTAPGHAFSFTDKNINEESHAWFGPLSMILILPALFIEGWRGVRQRSYLLLGPVLALLLFLPMEIILRPGWDPYQGRYFAPLVALCAPLMAFWFKEKGNAWYEWLIGALAVVFLFVTLLYNPAKPTLGKWADDLGVWRGDRVFVQTIQNKNERPLYYQVEKNVPGDASLGYYIPFYILDYPLFGEHLTRRLVPLASPEQYSDLKWLREQGIDYLLMSKDREYPLPPPEYQVISKWPGWKLYAYQPAQ